MATFRYVAKTAAGEHVAGVVQADNEAAALRTLDDRSLYPVRVEPGVEETRRARGGKVRMRDVAVAYGQLADLLRAGAPLLRSLETLSRATPNAALSEAMARVAEGVAEGKTLAEAMATRSHAFPALHTAMVRAGERGGFLEDVLGNLAEYLDRVDDLRSKVRGAMIYPIVLTCIGTLALLFVLVWLVPKFRSVFGNTPLPLPSRMLFAVSGTLVDHWAMLLGIGVLVVLAVVALLRSEAGRRRWETWRLRIPGVGALVRIVAITRFCRILGTLLHNGVLILQALAISKDATGSTVLAESIDRATDSVRAGEKLAAPLARSGFFPPEIVEMIAVAEESNQMEKVLLQIADAVERRTNRKVDTVVRLVEPLILVVIAGLIGFVALGLMVPIFTMSRMMR